MSLSDTIHADRRARSNYMPYCPCCSLQVGTKAQMLHGPSLRTVTFPKSRDYPQGRTVVKIEPCCPYSSPADNYFESEPEAAQWWREARRSYVGNPATEQRRLRTMARLEAAQLEPIE